MSPSTAFLPLSAHDEERLRALSHAWSAWLRGDGASLPLTGMWRTAALGRGERLWRFCPAGSTHDELASICDAFADNASEPSCASGNSRAVVGEIGDPVAALALASEELAFAEAALRAAKGVPPVLKWLAGDAAPVRPADAEIVARCGLDSLLGYWAPGKVGDAKLVDVQIHDGESARTTLLRAVAQAWCEGVAIDWSRVLPPGVTRAPGPPTPWRRRRFSPPPAIETVASASVERKPGPLPSDSTHEPPLAWIVAALGRVTGASPPVDATLASLGFDSLMALEVQELARIERGVELPLRTLTPGATVGEVAASLGAAVAVTRDAHMAPRSDGTATHEPFELTDVQRAYWLGRQDDYPLGGVACHWYAAWDVPEDLDVDRLESAFDALVERHPMLRAVVDSDGRQRVLPEVGAFCVRRDLESAERIEAELSHHVADPTRWPMFCVAVAEPADGLRRLAISFDLMIADGAAIVQLGRELDQLMGGGTLGPAPGLTFRDYLKACAGPVPPAARAYWQRRTPHLPEPPQLPLVVAPDALRRTRFARQRLVMERDDWRRLRDQASHFGLTPSGLLCAAFAETLSLHAKDPRFLLNVTTYHRRPVHEDISRIVGDFTSLTLLDVDASGTEGFDVRARRLQTQLWDALEHRDVGGVAVLREQARHNPATAGAPVVFTSLLSHTADQPPPFAVFGEPVHQLSQTPQIWLDHQVADRAGALELTFDYVEALLPPHFMASMARRHLDLLTRLASDPAAWASSRPTAVAAADLADRTRANATTVVREPGLLHDPVLAQARRNPDAAAVITADTTLTFRDLQLRSAAVTSWLQARALGRGYLVAIVMPKCPEQIVAALGVLRSGAAYLPIDASLPTGRICQLLAEGRPAAVLTTGPAARSVPDGLPCLLVDSAGTAHDCGPCRTSQDDLAYVVFTSGSTGTPKGVLIEHGAAQNTVLDCNERFRVTPQDRVLGISSFSFDLSVWDSFGVPGAGGAVVLPTASGLPNPREWIRLAREARVSIWNSVPAIAGLLNEHLTAHSELLPETLRLMMLSGDWIPMTLSERLRSQASDRNLEIISLGGATEVSIWSMSHPIVSVEEGWTSIPYGRPLANQTVHVLDATLQERPDWVPGDLYLGGDGLARGYLNDQEKTNRAFVIAPDGCRLYKTGDLGRWRPTGIVEFLGREDDQVKVNGYRVELGEIEAVLSDHPNVVAAVARLSERRLAAYLVPTDGGVDTTAVREYAAQRLPPYMVPTLLATIDVIPLTVNGKVDRESLPSPNAPSSTSTREVDDRDVSVTDPAEGEAFSGLASALRLLARGEKDPPEALRALLTRRLRLQLAQSLRLAVDDVDTSASFAALGLDSLAAIELRGAIDAAFDLRLPLRRLAGTSTPRDLALRLAATIGERAGPDADADMLAGCLTAVSDTRRPEPDDDPAPHDPFPLTEIQQAYWIGRNPAFALGGVACHFYAEWEGPRIDTQRLQVALSRLVDRHPMLRAVVDHDGRQRVPTVVPEPVVAVGEGESTLLAWRAELEANVPDPQAEPLWSIRVVHLEDKVSRTLVSFDLLVADGMSLARIGTELDALYEDPDRALPPLDLTFKQVVGRAADPKRIADDRAYWRRQVQELRDGPRLPLIRSPRDIGIPVFRRVEAHLEPRIWDRLRAQAKRRSLSPSAVLCAAYAEVLATQAADPDFTLAVTTTDRPPMHPDIGMVVGDFTSVTPLAVRAHGGRSFAEAAEEVQRRLWQDLEHTGLSAVGIARERGRARRRPPEGWPVVFTSLLALDLGDRQPDPLHRFGRMVYAVSQTPQVWMDHQVRTLEQGLSLTWDVVDDLFPDGFVDALFAQYTERVRQLASDDEAWASVTPVREAAQAPTVPARSESQPAPGQPDPPAALVARVVSIVADVLGRADIDQASTLADLGASSLELVRIISRLEAETGRRPRVDEGALLAPLSVLAVSFNDRQRNP